MKTKKLLSTKELLSQAIDNLPYFIKPKSYSSFKENLMSNATTFMSDHGKWAYEVVYDALKELCNKNSITPKEKELIDWTFVIICFLTSDSECGVQFKIERTPLTELCAVWFKPIQSI